MKDYELILMEAEIDALFEDMGSDIERFGKVRSLSDLINIFDSTGKETSNMSILEKAKFAFLKCEEILLDETRKFHQTLQKEPFLDDRQFSIFRKRLIDAMDIAIDAVDSYYKKLKAIENKNVSIHSVQEKLELQNRMFEVFKVKRSLEEEENNLLEKMKKIFYGWH